MLIDYPVPKRTKRDVDSVKRVHSSRDAPTETPIAHSVRNQVGLDVSRGKVGVEPLDSLG